MKNAFKKMMSATTYLFRQKDHSEWWTVLLTG